MSLPRLVLWLSVATFGGFGLAFTLAPVPMASLVDISLPSPTARIDFAATYGGLELGLALALAWCARRRDRLAAGLYVSGFGLMGFAVVRGLGILTASPVRPLLYVLLAAEIGGTALCLWAARLADRTDA